MVGHPIVEFSASRCIVYALTLTFRSSRKNLDTKEEFFMKKTALRVMMIAGCLAFISCDGNGRTNGDGENDAADVIEDEAASDSADTPVDPGDADGTDTETDPRLDISEEREDMHDVAEEVSDAEDGHDATDIDEEEMHAWYGIACGFDICEPPQVCCWDTRSEPAAPECTSESACVDIHGFILRCDGPEDCGAGESCCCSNCHFDEFLPESSCIDIVSCERLCHTEDDCNAGELCCGFVTNGGFLLSSCYDGTICPP